MKCMMQHGVELNNIMVNIIMVTLLMQETLHHLG